jgi:porin
MTQQNLMIAAALKLSVRNLSRLLTRLYISFHLDLVRVVLIVTLFMANFTAVANSQECGDGCADLPFESCSDGGICGQETLTGDWGGFRTALKDQGFDFRLSLTQFYQDVTNGGRIQDGEYGGKVDGYVDFNGTELFGNPGLFVNIHAESRYGQDANNIDGLLAPSNIIMSFPEPGENITSLTGVKVTQALSENFALFMGKINTLDEFPLKYHGEPGRTGFMNTSLVFNPIAARTVVYSAAGFGAAYLQDGKPVAVLSIFDPEERATRGLDDLFERGYVIIPDFTLRTNIFDLPGTHNFGGTYSTASYRSIERASYLNLRFPSGGARENNSWSLYYNSFQALWADADNEEHAWGVFGMLGISDGNPNPIRYVANGGIAGQGVIPGRELDTFGVGFFYLGLSEEFKSLLPVIAPQQDERGVEIFYNLAITPWCRLTGDLQVVEPSTQRFDTAVIAGARLQILL